MEGEFKRESKEKIQIRTVGDLRRALEKLPEGAQVTCQPDRERLLVGAPAGSITMLSGRDPEESKPGELYIWFTTKSVPEE